MVAVSSGSVTVNADSSVQILAEMAAPVDQLDPAVGGNLCTHCVPAESKAVQLMYCQMPASCSIS